MELFDILPRGPFLRQSGVYHLDIRIPVRSFDMNALAWVNVSGRLSTRAKSTNVGKMSSGRRLGSSAARRHPATPSLYTRTSQRTIFGFSFAPKQKEPAATDGLSSYGMEKLRPASEDNSDLFGKNPMHLTKSDAKGEYGFHRLHTDIGMNRPFSVDSFDPQFLPLTALLADPLAFNPFLQSPML